MLCNKMATRFWFRNTDSVGLGCCDGCNRIGPEERLCLYCCADAGMVIGTCFACMNDGPIWEMCHWCPRGRYLGDEYGMCECDWLGPVGDECTMCGDGVFLSLIPSVEIETPTATLVLSEVLFPIDDDDDSVSPSVAIEVLLHLEVDRRVNARLARRTDGPVACRTRSKTK